MEQITTIVHFEVPAMNAEQFFTYWRDHIRPAVSNQAGLIDGVFHRVVDPQAPYQFINVARWESADALAAGLRAASTDLPEMGAVLQELGVRVSQNNYSAAVSYNRAGGYAASQ
jgi:heme-degrading monooxygenase HmoA